MPGATNRGDVAPGATETLKGAQKAGQPAVTYIVSWQAPTKIIGRIPIIDGCPGSTWFATEAEAEAKVAELEARGHRALLWTLQEVG